jgi:predicted peptidase
MDGAFTYIIDRSRFYVRGASVEGGRGWVVKAVAIPIFQC